PTSGTVLRSVVHVEVSSTGRKEPRELGTVTLVRDSVTPRIHLDVNLLGKPETRITIPNATGVGTLGKNAFASTSLLAPSVLDYFEEVNSFPDVSVGEFRKLLADRGTTRTGVSRPGRTLDLHFPFAAGHVSGIREAIFRVEKDTFLPAELILAMGETDHLR